MTNYEVYHGSTEGTNYSGAMSSTLGEWFGTDSKEYAQRYGTVHRYKIVLINPYHMDVKEFRSYDRGPLASLKRSREFKEKLIKIGYDGIIVTHHDNVKEYILFDKRMKRRILI